MDGRVNIGFHSFLCELWGRHGSTSIVADCRIGDNSTKSLLIFLEGVGQVSSGLGVGDIELIALRVVLG